MDTEEVTMEEKCENLMNVVVESRKNFGKMCADYEHKKNLMENKILHLQIDTISNYRFKSKNVLPSINLKDTTEDIDSFATEIMERRQKIDSLRKKITDTQKVVFQLKQDNVGRKFRQPLSVDTLINNAKHKQNVGNQ